MSKVSVYRHIEVADDPYTEITIDYVVNKSVFHMEFLVGFTFNLEKFLSGDILLESDDGTNSGSRWELRKTEGAYMYTLGPMCASSPRYVTYYIREDDPVMLELISMLE